MRSLQALALCAALAACKSDTGISRDLGAACRDNGDCTRRCLPDPRWPAGFCSLDCAAASGCPVGADCVATLDGDVCLFACFDDRDCTFLGGQSGVAWRCRSLDGPGGQSLVCVPAASRADAGAT